eukprot:365509-Chlamydomonas_euryale.AAC.29
MPSSWWGSPPAPPPAPPHAAPRNGVHLTGATARLQACRAGPAPSLNPPASGPISAATCRGRGRRASRFHAAARRSAGRARRPSTCRCRSRPPAPSSRLRARVCGRGGEVRACWHRRPAWVLWCCDAGFAPLRHTSTVTTWGGRLHSLVPWWSTVAAGIRRLAGACLDPHIHHLNTGCGNHNNNHGSLWLTLSVPANAWSRFRPQTLHFGKRRSGPQHIGPAPLGSGLQANTQLHFATSSKARAASPGGI